MTISRTVLITGAGKRIGRALALDLAAHDWQVAVHYNRSKTAADEVVEQITARGGRAFALRADLGDLAQVKTMLPSCIEALGVPECLINNASLFEPDGIETLEEEKWDRHLSVNLQAPIFLARQFAASLKKGKKGNIINILDQKVWNLTPYYFSYTISKAGLWTATQTLAQALSPHIRVNAIGPGPTLPNARQSQAEFERQCSLTPLQRGTSPDEIARGVRFILDAPAMTGQMIALDGGRHIAWQTKDVTNITE